VAFDLLMPLATYPDPTPEEALGRAIDLAATLTGRVTAVVHELDLPPVSNPVAEATIQVSELVAQAEAGSSERGAALLGKLQYLANYFRLDFETRRLRCRPAELTARLARLARTYDFVLAVVAKDSAVQREMAEGTIFGAGGPVVLLPGEEAPAHLNSVFVAWDGSRAAARAVRDALPILRLAKGVTVVTVEDDKPMGPGGAAELHSFLAFHGIASRHSATTRGNESIGAKLQSHALEQDAGMLVMGAYGHSWLQELVLGGATREIIANPRLPVLVSH
jgi:nucleotide-binding universal stress UspA family protein